MWAWPSLERENEGRQQFQVPYRVELETASPLPPSLTITLPRPLRPSSDMLLVTENQTVIHNVISPRYNCQRLVDVHHIPKIQLRFCRNVRSPRWNWNWPIRVGYPRLNFGSSVDEVGPQLSDPLDRIEIRLWMSHLADLTEVGYTVRSRRFS